MLPGISISLSSLVKMKMKMKTPRKIHPKPEDAICLESLA